MREKMQIILIRHGQTEWNRVERFRGRADVALNQMGLNQAEATGRRVAAEWKLSAVYSSPLSRAVKTAQAVAKHFNLPVHTHNGLLDIDYGEWQGLTPAEVGRRWPEALRDWFNSPHIARIPGGESLQDLRERGMEMIHDLTKRHVSESIALVGHTVINRVLLLGMLGLGNERFWHLKQDTCAINVIECEARDFTIVSLNDTCHLRELTTG